MDLLIEKFFEGHEIDIDMLVQNNEVVFASISDNFACDENFFFERGGTTPSFVLLKDEVSLVKSLSSKWIRALNIQNGCLHFEAICRPKSMYPTTCVENFLMPIEINLRLGGAETWAMVNSTFGVNLFLEAIDISLGVTLNKQLLSYKETNPLFSSISNDYHPARSVFINSIEIDFEMLQKNENISEICLFRSSGDTLKLQDYMGWLTVRMDRDSSYDELLKERERVMGYLNINLVDA